MDLAQHVAKANDNWALLRYLESLSDLRDAYDWRIVITAYTALHLVDTFLHAHGEDHGRSHGERNRILRDLGGRGEIRPEGVLSYLRLFARSRAVRYSEVRADAADYHRLVSEDFRRVEAEILRQLSQLSPLARLPFEPSA